MRRLTLTTLGLASTLLLASPAGAQVLYQENFDAFPLCGTSCGNACVLPAASGWTNSLTDDIDWTVDSGGTGSSGTGPSADHTLGNGTGRYLYTEASNPCFNDTAELLSPVINLAGTTAPVARVWYHMFGTDQGQLHVDLIQDPNNSAVRTNDVVPPITDNLDAWQQLRCIPLDPAAGQVQVLFRGVTGPNFRSDMAIDDFIVEDPGLDVAITAVRVIGGCAGTVEVEVDIANEGGGTLGNFAVQYTANGGAPVVETFAGTLAACGTATHRFTTPITAPAGALVVDAAVSLVGDTNPANDTGSATIDVAPVIGAFPYTEDFEASDGAWIASGTPLWAHGVPADQVIGDAHSGAQAWVTGLNANYPDNAQAFLTSPCFDATALSNPRFEAYIEIEAEFSWDGAQVQTSTDGVNWLKVGSPSPGWYNDGTIAGLAFTGSQQGFTGRTNTNNGSNGWRLVAQDLGNGTAGSLFQVRIVFGSDTSVTDEGIGIDTVSISDNPPRLEITDQTTPNLSAVPPGASDVVVQALRVESFVNGTDLQALTFQRQGTLPDSGISVVRLWRDDGDGVPEPGGDDALAAAPATFSAGVATFTLSPAVAIAAQGGATFFVTFDLAVGVAGGLSFGTSLGAPGLVAHTGAQPVTFPNGPALSPLSSTFAPMDILPFSDGFGGAPAINRRAAFRQGTFPTATSTGTQVGTSALTANDATVGVVQAAGPVVPNTAPGMAAIAFLDGPATGAIDYYFDLSSYDVNTDDVFIELFHEDVNATDDPEDHVFVSLDGGLTWAGSIYDFDFSSPGPAAWTEAQIDLSAFLRAAGLTFTNNVVVRIQAAGAPTDAVLIDDLWAGIPEHLRLERLVGAPIVSGGTDTLGGVPGGLPVTVTYTLHNDGQRDLVARTSSITVTNATNVTVVGLGPDVTVAPVSSATVAIELMVPAPGAFGADLSFATNDPRLPGTFAFSLSGFGAFDPDIDVSLADGTPTPSGTGLDLGELPLGGVVTQDMVLANLGGVALALTGTPTVELASLVNVTGEMVSAVPRVIAPFATAPFTVSFSPAARGAFSAQLVIVSSDPDESPYTIDLSGVAVEPDIAVSRGGTDLPDTSSDDLGPLEVGVPQTLTYVIENVGNTDLVLDATPRVALFGVPATVTATVTMMPTSTVAPGATTDLVLALTVDAEATFGFDLVIRSNDPDEGAFTLTLTGSGFVPAPEISVTRGGAEVANGATEDVGGSVLGVAQTLTYSVTNPGTLDLVLSGPVTTVNASNVEVSVSTQPATTIAPAGSEALVISYTPIAEGNLSFDVVIESNDADEGTYTITVQGAGDAQAPEIAVEQPTGTDRADGATIDLGEVDVGAAQTLTFTVRNEGAGPLSLTADPRVALDNLVNTAATLDQAPDSPIAAGASTTFTVTLTPASAGAFSAALSLPNDDGNEGSFGLTLSGTAKDGGTGPGPGDGGDDDGGCGCTAARGDTEAPAWAGFAALGLLFALRRRRR